MQLPCSESVSNIGKWGKKENLAQKHTIFVLRYERVKTAFSDTPMMSAATFYFFSRMGTDLHSLTGDIHSTDSEK